MDPWRSQDAMMSPRVLRGGLSAPNQQRVSLVTSWMLVVPAVVVVVVVVVESSSSSNCCFGTCCCCSYCCSVGCCHPSSSKSKNSSKAMTREREMIKNSNSSNSIPKNCLYWHSFVQIWSLEVAEAYEHHPSHEIIDKGIPSLQHSTTSLKELSSNSFVL